MFNFIKSLFYKYKIEIHINAIKVSTNYSNNLKGILKIVVNHYLDNKSDVEYKLFIKVGKNFTYVYSIKTNDIKIDYPKNILKRVIDKFK